MPSSNLRKEKENYSIINCYCLHNGRLDTAWVSELREKKGPSKIFQ